MAEQQLSKKEIEELRLLIRTLDKEINDLDFNNLVRSGSGARRLLESLRKEADAFTSEISNAALSFRGIVDEIRKTNTTANDVAKSFNKLSSISEQIKFHQSGISALSLKEVEALKSKVQSEKEKLKLSEASLVKRKIDLGLQLEELNVKKSTKGLTEEESRERRKIGKEYEKTKSALENINLLISGQDSTYKNLILTLNQTSNQIEKQAKDTRELLGLSGAAVDGVSKALEKLGFGGLAKQLGIDEAKDKMRALADQIIADREKEITLNKSINELSSETSKLSSRLNDKEQELLKTKEKIVSIDTLTQRKKELDLQLEELKNKRKSVGLTKEEIKEKTALRREYRSIEASLKNLGSTKDAKELESSLERQVEITKNRKEELNKILENNKEELKTIAGINKQYNGLGGKIATLKTGFASIEKSLIDTLKDPAVISGFIAGILITGFKKLVELGFEVNKRVIGLSKSMAISANEARNIRQGFVDIERGVTKFNDSLDFTLATEKNLVEAQLELANAFGTSRGFTNQQLRDQILLTKQIGLSGDEANGLQSLMESNNITADQIINSTIKQTSSLFKQKGIQLDNKKILGEVAKVSGQLRLQYQNNPALIAQAVVQTQRLGVSLQQAADASKSLLDFESSITNELTAELLTGREFNMERARLLRLNGKVAESMAEIFNEINVSSAQFANMNTIQQEAIAQLAGMTADEFANSLIYQENINKLGKETKKQIENQINELKKQGKVEEANRLMRSVGSEEEAEKALKSIDIQTKFNNLIEKLQAILGNLASGEMEKLLDRIIEWVSNTENINKLTEVFRSLAEGLAKTVKFIADNFNSIVLVVGTLATIITARLVAGLVAAVAQATLLRTTMATTSMGGMPAGGMPMGGAMSAGGALLKGIGIPLAGTAIAMGLSNVASKKYEEEAQARQLAQTSQSEEEKRKYLKQAEEAKNSGKKFDVASTTATFATYGATIGSFVPGVGTAVGAGVGALAGLGYGLYSQYGEENAESVDDFILRPGQKPIKFRKDDIIAGSTNEEFVNRITTPPSTMNQGNANIENAIKRLEESFVKAVNNISNRPIEVKSTIDLDGERVGTGVSKYATSNGTVINQFTYKVQ